MGDETPPLPPAPEAEIEAPAPKKFVPTFKVQRFIDAAQLKRDLAINPSDVGNAFLEHASIRLHYGELLAKATRQHDDLKMVLEANEAKVDKAIRNEAAAAGEKLTEPQIAKRVAVHERVLAYRRLLNEARQIETLAKQAVEAFRDRKDMLVSYGLKDREEMRGELAIRRQSAAEIEGRNQRERVVQNLALPAPSAQQ